MGRVMLVLGIQAADVWLVWCVQVAGELSFAAAAAFLSLVLGRGLPDTAAFHAELALGGALTGHELNSASLTAARTHGITTILASR